MERIVLTKKGAEKLRKKLKHLLEVERPQNIKEIEEARAHGDLSENAEYSAAKEKQALIEAQIRDLEYKLSHAEIIDPSTIKSDKIMFGATVKLYDLDKDEELEYQLVGPDEAEPHKGLISVRSPLGRALLGKEVGDVVTVRTPGGVRELEIVEIRYE